MGRVLIPTAYATTWWRIEFSWLHFSSKGVYQIFDANSAPDDITAYIVRPSYRNNPGTTEPTPTTPLEGCIHPAILYCNTYLQYLTLQDYSILLYYNVSVSRTPTKMPRKELLTISCTTPWILQNITGRILNNRSQVNPFQLLWNIHAGYTRTFGEQHNPDSLAEGTFLEYDTMWAKMIIKLDLCWSHWNFISPGDKQPLDNTELSREFPIPNGRSTT